MRYAYIQILLDTTWSFLKGLSSTHSLASKDSAFPLYHVLTNPGTASFSSFAILVDMQWHLAMTQICLSPGSNAKCIEHLFINLSAIWISTFVKCLLRPFCLFRYWVVSLFLLISVVLHSGNMSLVGWLCYK